MKELGASYVTGDPWSETAVLDCKPATGQRSAVVREDGEAVPRGGLRVSGVAHSVEVQPWGARKHYPSRVKLSGQVR